jgi:AcrR family transcriptional regulator
MEIDVTQKKYQQRRRAETAEETRQRILGATFDLHGEQGMAATTMKQIAARAGVGVGTVYHHFPKVEDTVTACAQMVAETMPMPTEAMFEGLTALNARLLRLARELFGFYDRIRALEYVRQDQDFVPVLRDFAAQEDSHRLALTRAALAPFRVERALIPVAAAMLDVGVYKALQRIGMDTGQAATTVAELIEARVAKAR